VPDLRPEHLAIVRNIAAKHLPGREVRLFGSRVHGLARPFSDLDLVVMGEEGLEGAIRFELESAFDESDLPFRVDLVVWAEAPAPLREVIARASVALTSPSAPERNGGRDALPRSPAP
jgi:type I restriction enzyme S subunit